MENKDKPAYPTVDTVANGARFDPIHTDLTKRERVAMAAMQGIQMSVYSSLEMYKHQLIHWQEMYGNATSVKEAMAKDAIMQADELLKQLSE